MNLNLLINDKTDGKLTDQYKSIILRVLECALEFENIKSKPEISLYIINNKEIQELNKKFRDIDRPTDVLSFPLIDFNLKEFSNKPKDFLIKKNVLLGDIVISIEKVFEQAKNYGHSIERELGFLTAHGVLHLLGYDHINTEEKKIMFAKQEEILKKINLTR